MNERVEGSVGKPPGSGGDGGANLPKELAELATRRAARAQTDEELRTRTVPRRDQAEFDDEPEGSPETPRRLPFDPTRLIDALVRHWFSWITVGLFCGAAVCYWYISKPHTAAAMQLIRRDPPILFRASDAGEAFKPQQFTDQTITTLARSPELFRRISERTNPRIPIGKLASSLFAMPERDTELVTLYYKGPHPPATAVNLLNLFAEEMVRFTQEMQTREGLEVVKSLGEKLATVETNIASVEAELQSIPPEKKFTDPDHQIETYLVQLSELDMKYELARIEMEVNDPVAEKLQAARDELAAMLLRYTEVHPLVQDQKAKVAALEHQLAESTNQVAAGVEGKLLPGSRNRLALRQIAEIKALREDIRNKLNALSQKNVGYALIKSRHQSLEMIRTMLVSRQREAQIYAQNANGYYRISAPASIGQASDKTVWSKLVIFTLMAAFAGMAMTAGLVLLVEVADSRIRSVGDLERITGLPVMATLGDLGGLSAGDRQRWAFRTWTILRGKISQDHKRAMVCGLISARHGEGRSTWISLLANTAHQRGLRVMVAATRPSPEPALQPHEPVSDQEGVPMKTTANVVAFPFQATQHLNDPKSHAIVHIPLPGWVWNLERRLQWQSALVEWMKIENLVLLVELPPASEPEAVLLAEHLPQLIWLADSGKATMAETRDDLELLRHAGCNLVGAVLNHEPQSFCKKHLSRWLGVAAVFLTLSAFAQPPISGDAGAGTGIQSNAVTALPVPPAFPASLQRAQWQRNLTLGPGDILNLSYYGETNWTKFDVTVGMDGRISYLQAQNVLASGLTVDQLRDALNNELAKYYRTPRVMVAPVAYRSKKYYMLGRVVTKGAYVLDRPISILEAVSRARGLETGMAERNVVDLTDMQRSFLLRHGARAPVDFERLFLQGDFSQNVQLEPDDFLYFAPAMLKEVYVLGEVRVPGIAPLTEGSSVVRVIAERGGFTDTAFKHHVLVIRGSLNHPQTFVVNSWAVLDARVADFKLMPRDIIYVSRRPFLRAEELLDVGVTAFLQSATTSWTGDNIGPLITSPFLPKL